MIKWLKKLISIVSTYDSDQQVLSKRSSEIAQRQNELDRLIKDRTDIAVDVGVRGDCQVFLIGRYRNNDFIQTYSINLPDFESLVEYIKALEKHGILRRLDAPAYTRAVFARHIRLA